MKNGLLIFVKNLEEGKVKTRLAATVGNKAAFDVYRKLLNLTAHNVTNLVADKIVFYSEYIEMNDIWRDSEYQKRIQQGNNLGERMVNAFDCAFELGYGKLVIIGSDCPQLHSELIETAFNKLEHIDVVIGPATDGGYYLIAIKIRQEGVFHDIIWSSDKVLSQTLLNCKNLELSTFLLPELSDIDVEADWMKVKDSVNSKLATILW